MRVTSQSKFDSLGGDKVWTKRQNMADRKRDPRFGNVTGYIPKELVSRFKEAMRSRGLTQHEAIEAAIRNWLGDETSNDIHELVANNFDTLVTEGMDKKKLNAIARKEFLPTPQDFGRIIGILELEEEKAHEIWNKTYCRKEDHEFIKSSK